MERARATWTDERLNGSSPNTEFDARFNRLSAQIAAQQRTINLMLKVMIGLSVITLISVLATGP